MIQHLSCRKLDDIRNKVPTVTVDSLASGHKLGVKRLRVLGFLQEGFFSDDSTCHILNSNGYLFSVTLVCTSVDSTYGSIYVAV